VVRGDWSADALSKDKESDVETAQSLVKHYTKKLFEDIDAKRDSNATVAKLHAAEAAVKKALESRKAPAAAPPAPTPAESKQSLPPANLPAAALKTIWQEPPKTQPPPMEVDGHLKKLWPNPPDSIMSDAEARTRGNYISMGYEAINGHLRKPKDFPTPAVIAAVKNMDALFEKVPPLEKEVMVYRGISGSSADKILALKKGATLSDAAFVSTSLSQDVAKDFATVSGVVVSIRVPKGHRVVPGERTENELILPRGARFKVVKKTKKSVVLEVVQ
jgi:hypothetical protein